MNGVELIAQERQRQIEKEGWTPKHDDKLTPGVLGIAGACYALDAAARLMPSWKDELELRKTTLHLWPFDSEWFKPTSDSVRQLTKAGALIAAEIDRLQRLQGNPSKGA